MNVLVACEFSGIVRSAFADLGHNAWSCDLLPTELPGSHYQGDVRELLAQNLFQWDLIIGHPNCTFLTNSGVRWLYEKDDSPEERARVKKRWGSLEQAREFFMFLYEQPAPYICIENPIPHSHAQLPPYTQTVQPWQYGDFETKRTCLWLRNLPPLKPLNPTLDDARAYHNLAPDAKPAAKVHLMSPGPNRAKERSRFFPGIARAMAQQWTDFINGDV